MLPLETDADVPGVLQRQIGHVRKVHITVITKLILLIGEVDLGLFEDLEGNGELYYDDLIVLNSWHSYLNVLGEVIVGVDIDPRKSPNLVKGEDEANISRGKLLPTHPVIA